MTLRRIDLPTTEEAIRALHVGEEVALYGRIVTGRDAAHQLMVERQPEWLRPLLQGSFIYHCGPVMKREGMGWKVVAAGPTTSLREEPYQADVIGSYGLRGVIGKGGMGAKTLAACERHGAVYCHAIGGAAVAIAAAIKRVVEVRMLEELGQPEAFWVLEVEDLRGVITMDSHGGSLHKEVQDRSTAIAQKLFGLV